MLLAYHNSLAVADVNTLFYGLLYSPPAKVINHHSHILVVFGLYSVIAVGVALISSMSMSMAAGKRRSGSK